MPRPIVYIVLLLAFCVAFLCTAFARDNGQWENSDPAVSDWFRTLKQPDNPTVSCCGEADAYWADEIHVRDGKTFAVITDDRDDGPLMRPHVDIGTEIEIPTNKLKWDRGNPTGHNVLFMHPGGESYTPTVWCFVQSSGI